MAVGGGYQSKQKEIERSQNEQKLQLQLHTQGN